MLVTFLVIMLLRLSQLSQTLPPFLDNHAIWMSWSHRDCYMRSFSIHLLDRNTRPSQVIPSSMIVTKTKKLQKSWDLAVLLWEIVWCILLNARRRPQPIAAACEGLAKLGCQPHLWVSSILPLIMHPSSHLCAADVCVWTSSSHSELHSLLCSSLHIIAPSSLFLFTVWH